MLRIAKSTPGVLDLSAVKDEHGLPVTLIGPSHRDVPDHEGDNPVLQRIVELGWVTMFPVPLAVPAESSPVIDQPPFSTETNDTEAAESAEPPTNADAISILPPPPIEMSDNVVDAQSPTTDTGAEQPLDEAMPDTPAKPEGSAKPSGKSDARRAGRRS